MPLKNRSEMNPEFMWDLTPIFESADAWNAALERANEAVKSLESLPGTLGTSAEALHDAAKRIMDAEAQAERVYVYAFLNKSGDNGDPHSQEMSARAISPSARRSTINAVSGFPCRRQSSLNSIRALR